VSWQETISVIIVLAGLGAGAFLIAQRPSFWIEFGVRIFKAILPTILKRMPPEEEAAWRKCQLRGGKWNHRKRRCE
jgi:nucleoside recognition membrane protein YjiH